MTPAQERFVVLEKVKDEYKAWLEQLAEATKAVAEEVGVDGYFQDDEGTVYKVVVPAGRFVHYEAVSYVRTKRAGEERGSLSLKEVEAAGFKVK